MNDIKFAENIKQLRKSRGLTMEELGKSLGKAKSSISAWENGYRTPKIGEIQKISDFFGITKSELLGIEEINENEPLQWKVTKILKQLEEPRQQIVLDTAKFQLKEQKSNNIISLKEWTYNYYDNAVSAGTGQYLTDGKQETITLPVDYDADFVVPICGDSMEPIYHDWDYVFIKNTYDLSDGDIGVFILDGDAYIKELRVDDEGAFLHSLNPKYRDKPILPEADFRIIGKVIGRYNEKDN